MFVIFLGSFTSKMAIALCVVNARLTISPAGFPTGRSKVHDSQCVRKGKDPVRGKVKVHPLDGPIEGTVEIQSLSWFHFNNCSIFNLSCVGRKTYKKIFHLVSLLLLLFVIFPPSVMAQPWLMHIPTQPPARTTAPCPRRAKLPKESRTSIRPCTDGESVFP